MFLLRDELYLQVNSRVKKKARNGEHFGEFDKVDVLNRLLSREIGKFGITLIHHVNFSDPHRTDRSVRSPSILMEATYIYAVARVWVCRAEEVSEKHYLAGPRLVIRFSCRRPHVKVQMI